MSSTSRPAGVTALAQVPWSRGYRSSEPGAQKEPYWISMENVDGEKTIRPGDIKCLFPEKVLVCERGNKATDHSLILKQTRSIPGLVRFQMHDLAGTASGANNSGKNCPLSYSPRGITGTPSSSGSFALDIT